VSKPTPHRSVEEVNRKVLQTEIFISTLLRVGVRSSLLVVCLGTILTFTHHPNYVGSKRTMSGLTAPGAAFPRTAREVGEGIVHLRGQAIVVLGLLLLVATPVLRVAISVLAFFHQRDWVFVAITSFVLALLLLSFFLGKAEG
jgi:uncharacterized membrane protein